MKEIKFVKCNQCEIIRDRLFMVETGKDEYECRECYEHYHYCELCDAYH